MRLFAFKWDSNQTPDTWSHSIRKSFHLFIFIFGGLLLFVYVIGSHSWLFRVCLPAFLRFVDGDQLNKMLNAAVQLLQRFGSRQSQNGNLMNERWTTREQRIIMTWRHDKHANARNECICAIFNVVADQASFMSLVSEVKRFGRSRSLISNRVVAGSLLVFSTLNTPHSPALRINRNVSKVTWRDSKSKQSFWHLPMRC